MKLSKFDIDKKLSITQMKQVKAGSVSTSSGSNFAVTNVGLDSDRGSELKDANF